jgi:FlgO protein
MMLRQYSRVALLLLSSLMVGGCAISREVPLADCEISRAEVISKLDLKVFVDSAMEGVCSETSEWLRDSSLPVLVPDAVDIQTLEPGNLGIVLGELVRGNVINSCKSLVRQLEATQQVRLNETGVTILSRNVPAGQTRTVSADVAIVGAYNLERGRLTLTLRRIRLADSTIESIRSSSLKWACMKPPVVAPRFRQEIS